MTGKKAGILQKEDRKEGRNFTRRKTGKKAGILLEGGQERRQEFY